MANDTSGSGPQLTELPRRRPGPGAPVAVLLDPADDAPPPAAAGTDRDPAPGNEPEPRAEQNDSDSVNPPTDPAMARDPADAEDRVGMPQPRGGVAGGTSPRPPSALPMARRVDVEPASAAEGTFGSAGTGQQAGASSLPAWPPAEFGQTGHPPAGADPTPGPPGDSQPGAPEEAEVTHPTSDMDAELPDRTSPEPEQRPGDLEPHAPAPDEEASARPAWDWASVAAAEPVALAPESPVDAAAGPLSTYPSSDDVDTDPHGLKWQRYFAPVPTRTVARPVSVARPVPRGLVAAGLVAALIGGAVGGAVGFTLAGARSGYGDAPGVLAQPLPEPAPGGPAIGPAESVAAKVLPSVVQLRVDGASSAGEGSGLVLSSDGLLLTNNHVVESAARSGRVTAVFQDGVTAPVDIIGRDPSFDLAVLRARKVVGLTPIELGNSDTVRVGQQVVAFGSPLGLGGTVTTGIISAINRPVSVGGDRVTTDATVLNALQTDAAINPGNSGGPLVDMQGQLIGINSAIATTGAEGGSIGVGFAIPVNQAKRVAEELERTGRASRAQLGVSVGDDPTLSGARIRSVDPGSAAEEAGLKAGDLVIRFGGQRIMAGEGLQAAVRSRAPRETVEVELADRTLSVTLGGSS